MNSKQYRIFALVVAVILVLTMCCIANPNAATQLIGALLAAVVAVVVAKWLDLPEGESGPNDNS